jgi:hypothetical protein
MSVKQPRQILLHTNVLTAIFPLECTPWICRIIGTNLSSYHRRNVRLPHVHNRRLKAQKDHHVFLLQKAIYMLIYMLSFKLVFISHFHIKNGLFCQKFQNFAMFLILKGLSISIIFFKIADITNPKTST